MSARLMIILSFWVCISSTNYAQDIIVKMNGDEIDAKVIEVGRKEIRYKIFENESDTIDTAAKSDIFMIKYENGTKDVFGVSHPVVKYEYKNPASAFGLSLMFPGLGQFYNGQKWKGIIMCTLAGSSYITSYATQRYAYTNSSRNIKTISQWLIVGTYIWSLTDASVSAHNINRRSQSLNRNMGNNPTLKITPDVLLSNTIGTKTRYQSPAYGFTLSLDF